MNRFAWTSIRDRLPWQRSRRTPPRSLLASALATYLLFGGAGGVEARAQQLTLASQGGATIGSFTTVEVSGTPGDQYLVLLSLSGGPTPLPLPHQPSSIDVGFDLLEISLAIPGFLGVIPPNGTAVIALPIPGPAILTQITLHLQALRIVNGVRFEGKSNPWKWRPAFPFTTREAIGLMPVPRAGHVVVAEPGGTFLFFGGGSDGLVASYGQTAIDRYDPATQTWSPVGDMLSARVSHSATRLADGRILLVGGADEVLGEPTTKAEIFDPVTATSQALPDLPVPRALHSASLLPDGRVLIAGGTTSFNSPQDIVNGALRTTLLFSPITQSFVAGPNLAEPKVGHTATTLQDGRVLIAGGFSWVQIIFQIPFVSDRAQLYSPNAGSGTFSSSITMTGDRFAHAAIRLDNGNVWIVGGAQDQVASPFDPVATNTIEEFDVATQTFSLVGGMTVARGLPAVVRLANGDILIAGGAFGALSLPTPSSSIDILNQQGNFIAAFDMATPRANFSASLLSDGTVLLAGGGEIDDPQNPGNPLSLDDGEIAHP
jgi:hypothetical protein